MILCATYRASGNHERTCVSGVVPGDAAGLASFDRLGAFEAATVESIADSVLIVGTAAVTSTDSDTAPTSRTTEKTARSPSSIENSRTAVLNPGAEIRISKLPAASSDRANRPSALEASV